MNPFYCDKIRLLPSSCRYSKAAHSHRSDDHYSTYQHYLLSSPHLPSLIVKPHASYLGLALKKASFVCDAWFYSSLNMLPLLLCFIALNYLVVS